MAQTLTKNEIVSSDVERLILVDEQDRVTGYLDKSSCHDGEGQLHRAFSLFIFNRQGELLLQRRARNKRLWPAYWSNSCCSHPRATEPMEVAVHRRLEQELGLQAELQFLYKFIYKARYRELGSEHEYCSVYVGRCDREPVINTTEIDEWCWISADDLNQWLADREDAFTPWFKMEWQRLNAEFGGVLQEFGVSGVIE